MLKPIVPVADIPSRSLVQPSQMHGLRSARGLRTRIQSRDLLYLVYHASLARQLGTPTHANRLPGGKI